MRTALTTISTPSSPGSSHMTLLPPASPKVVTSRPVRPSGRMRSLFSAGCAQTRRRPDIGRNVDAIATPLDQRRASRRENVFGIVNTPTSIVCHSCRCAALKQTLRPSLRQRLNVTPPPIAEPDQQIQPHEQPCRDRSQLPPVIGKIARRVLAHLDAQVSFSPIT